MINFTPEFIVEKKKNEKRKKLCLFYFYLYRQIIHNNTICVNISHLFIDKKLYNLFFLIHFILIVYHYLLLRTFFTLTFGLFT